MFSKCAQLKKGSAGTARKEDCYCFVFEDHI